ncbi:MAG: FG-GAP-like repeat-containing protein, partial [Candidatus Poribacteria bacterium]|nr:FG-GAP-like repeat-containing protein [Candidatus Poribacteria bacterium]
MMLRFLSPSIEKCLKYILLLVWCFATSIGWTQETNSAQIIEAAIRHQNLGLAYLEESQPSKAVEAFTALIELLPDEAIGYGNLAVAHLRLQQADAAEASVKRGIAVSPMDSQLHFILSEVYQLQQKSDLAVEAMKEAVRLAPDELEFRYKLVRHYIGQRNDPEAQQEAVRHLQALHYRSPVNIVVLMKLTLGLLAQEQLEAAGDLCQELMLLLGDTDAEKLAYLTQGIEAIEQKDLKLATRNIRIFENLHRASPRYQQGIGELVTDILGHPIETFSPGFRERIVAKQSPPIVVEFVDVTEALGLTDVGSLHTSVGSISLIDYDSDGNLDLYTTPTGTLYRNTGGHFSPIQQFQEVVEQTSLNPNTVAYADIGKDGTQDFLLQTFNGITRLRIDGDGKWVVTPMVQHKQAEDLIGVLLPIDFDHDGDLDIFSGQTSITMHQNNGNETFTDVSKQAFVKTVEAQQMPAEILSADFDDDGDIDIFVTHQETVCTLYDN